MIIGDDAYLTPAEVQQMRRVPDLVFINCCHLGRIESTGGKELNDRRDYNKIAANVSTEFIRMGVRAVVAAGWAVDDAAALTFATSFYNQMLRGATFGEAVKAARRETYEGYRHTNTWGAYQCYGDPDFRLLQGREDDGDTRRKQVFVSMAEAVATAENITARLSTKADQDQQGEREQLTETVKLVKEKGWLKNGKVCVALARAFRDTELFDEAIDYYRRALAVEPSAVGFKDIEQLANLLGRRAVYRFEHRGQAAGLQGAGRGKVPEGHALDLTTDIDEAIDLIKWLMDVPQGNKEQERGSQKSPKKDGKKSEDEPETISGKTVERYSLLGSAYKRQAWISPDPKTALQKMSKAYQEAYKLSVDLKKPDLYPLLNWIVAEVILDWKPARRGKGAKIRAGMANLKKAKELLSGPGVGDDPFWNAVNQTDYQLCEALLNNRLDKKTLDRLVEGYAEARRLGSRRKFASVLDQREFLVAMATKLKQNAIVQGLELLGKRLQSENQEGIG
jgi:tetratricopeptide (TPR) repeat protein